MRFSRVAPDFLCLSLCHPLRTQTGLFPARGCTAAPFCILRGWYCFVIPQKHLSPQPLPLADLGGTRPPALNLLGAWVGAACSGRAGDPRWRVSCWRVWSHMRHDRPLGLSEPSRAWKRVTGLCPSACEGGTGGQQATPGSGAREPGLMGHVGSCLWAFLNGQVL